MNFPTKLQQDEKAKAAFYAEARERGLQEIYRAFPIFPRNRANDLMLEEICSHFLGSELGAVPPTLSVFRSAVDADKESVMRALSVEAVARQKEKTIAEIQELLTGVMSPFDLKTEVRKLQLKTLEEVIARKQQIVERQRLSKMTVTQIRKEQASGQPPQHPYFPHERLPDITPEALKKILSTSEARTYVKRFGLSQLNDRLASRG